MKLEILQEATNNALKAHETGKVETLRGVIAAIKKAAIDKRIEIDEKLVDEVLLKEKKIIQEMIDTCPKDREDLMMKYTCKMMTINQYAPQLLDDPEEVRGIVIAALAKAGVEPGTANKGQIMKVIMPTFKSKVDMKIANQVIGEILNESK